MYSEIFDSFDKSFALADFAFEKASALYEMVEKNHELMYQEASVFVYAKDRSFEDLNALYEAADNDSAEKKEGLLSKMLGAIASIIKAIGDAIAKFFNKIRGKEVPKESSMPKKDADCLDDLPGVLREGESLLSKLTSPKGIFTALGVTGGVVGGLVAISKFKEKRKKLAALPEGQSESLVTVPGDKAAKSLDIIKKINEIFDKIVKSIQEKLSGLFGKKDAPTTDKKDDEKKALPEGESSSLTVLDAGKEGILKSALNFFQDCVKTIGDMAKSMMASITKSIFGSDKIKGDVNDENGKKVAKTTAKDVAADQGQEPKEETPETK